MRKYLPLLFFAALVSCTSIDCPMNHLVSATYAFYTEGDVSVSVGDELSVTTTRRDGSDTLLVNKMTNAHSVALPMSYAGEADTLLFTFTDTLGNKLSDRIIVTKTNEMHFESVDCGPSFFHEILKVTSTNNLIDSVKINYKDVNYDSLNEHIYVYLKN